MSEQVIKLLITGTLDTLQNDRYFYDYGHDYWYSTRRCIGGYI